MGGYLGQMIIVVNAVACHIKNVVERPSSQGTNKNTLVSERSNTLKGVKDATKSTE